MADIREIDMPQAKDANGKKIRLVGDDGKGYWMNFDDLAAVVGALLNISGLRAHQSESGDYLVGGYSIGFIFAYDKQDRSKNLLVYFTIEYATHVKFDVLQSNGLSVAGGNSYGSFSVSGGSDEYLYSVIGFGG